MPHRPFSLLLAAILAASHARADDPAGVVCHVKVLSDKAPDVSSLDAWKRSFLKDGMTDHEKALLAARGLAHVRLSCQIQCDEDMTVRAISRLAGSGRKDAGSRPADEIQPQPVQWTQK